MNRHLTPEELERYADGEVDASEAADMEQHLQQCAQCAAAALRIARMRRAIRDAMTMEAPSSFLRERVRRQMTDRNRAWELVAAAIVAVVLIAVFATRTRQTPSALPELVDMHVTLLASANPVDVISTDRHTVKPWFEGRLPFTVPVPDLAATPFRLIGGRVIYWHGNPAAYLLIGKNAHRISLFVFRDETAPQDLQESTTGFSSEAWRSGGLTFVAIGQVPAEDLRALSAAFAK